MRTLYILRHAKSSWKKAAVSDFDRPLSGRGKRDAPFMGRRLALAGVTPASIVTSPAKRARKTAQAVAEALAYPLENLVVEPRLYLASLDELLAVVGELDDACKSVMLVGHNPGLTELVNHVARKTVVEDMPTGAFAALRFTARSWRKAVAQPGELIAFDYPKRAGDA